MKFTELNKQVTGAEQAMNKFIDDIITIFNHHGYTQSSDYDFEDDVGEGFDILIRKTVSVKFELLQDIKEQIGNYDLFVSYNGAYLVLEYKYKADGEQ